MNANLLRQELTESRFRNPCCKAAYLAGFVRGAGSVYIEGGGMGLIIAHSSRQLVERCAHIISSLGGGEPSVIERQAAARLGASTVYELKLPPEASADLLNCLGITNGKFSLSDQIPAELISKDCCKKAFLTGLYLASGTLSLPDFPDPDGGRFSSSSYQLGITVNSENIAEGVAQILGSFDIAAKIRGKGETFVVYIKDKEKISDFCAVVDAVKTVLELQNLIASRSISNNSNRVSNCEVANIEKAVDAGAAQLAAINKIYEIMGPGFLEEPLRSTAEARRMNPEATLAQLAEILPDNPSKSGLSHRMKKLQQIAEELGAKEE